MMQIPRVGQVRFMHQYLFAQHGVIATRLPDAAPRGQPRPFLCIRAGNGESCWLALTRIPAAHGNKQRIEIIEEEKTGRGRSWRNCPTFVDDPSYLWTIPDAAIELIAANNENTTDGVLDAAVKRVLAAVESREERIRRWLPGGKAGAKAQQGGWGTIACYRVHKGREGVARHALIDAKKLLLSKLWIESVVHLLASDGTMIEFVCWKSRKVADDAKDDADVNAVWRRLEGCAEVVRLVDVSSLGAEFLETNVVTLEDDRPSN